MASKCSFVLALCAVFYATHATHVEQPPVVKQTPREVLFREQRQFELVCPMEGDAWQVKFEWQKDKAAFKPTSKVEQRNGSLVFSEPRAEDAGLYQCFITSRAGKASSRPISVKQAYLKAPKVQSNTIKPVEGKPFKLACVIPEGYPKPTIEWKKKMADGKMEDVSDGRITISPEGELYFSNATERDVSKDFKYVCIAKSPAVEGEVLLAEHSVEALEPNPKPDNEVVRQYVTPDGFTLEAGKQAYLYCIYGGSPLAHPTWFKDRENVDNSAQDRVTRYNGSKGKRLLIKEAVLEDAGQYTCVVDNEVGKTKSYVFNVNVVSAPKLLKKPNYLTQVKEGDDVLIPCEAQAKPIAESTWSFNAAPLANARATVGEKGLTLKNVQKGDRGYYGCYVANAHGAEYVETLLQVV